MRAGLLRASLRSLIWASVVILVALSLMPLEEIAALRTDILTKLSTSLPMPLDGDREDRATARSTGCFCLYAGILEYLQNFSPVCNPALVDSRPPTDLRAIYSTTLSRELPISPSARHRSQYQPPERACHQSALERRRL
jgi:hypothetical protein